MRMLLGAFALAATVVHGSARAGQVQTLYTSPAHQRIEAFAQDGQLLAWFEPSTKTRKCNLVWVWQLGHGKETLPAQGQSFHNVTCQWQVPPGSPVGLALAGNHGHPEALWTLRETASRVVRFDYVLGATLANPEERRFQEVAHARLGAGMWLGGIVGSGTSLLYSVVDVQYHDQVACLSAPTSAHACDLDVTGGAIYRVVGRKLPTPIRGAGPAVGLAVSGGEVAYLPAAASARADGQPIASPETSVYIRDVQTGDLIASIAPGGVPLAIGLSTTVLALLERTPSGLVLSWYDHETGELVHSITVPKATAPELAVGTTTIVYRDGHTIRAIDLHTHHVRVLAKAASTPIGLSIANDRVAWAEDVAGHGRIRAVTLAP